MTLSLFLPTPSIAYAYINCICLKPSQTGKQTCGFLFPNFYCIFLKGLKTSGTMLQNHETWDKIEFLDVNISNMGVNTSI